MSRNRTLYQVGDLRNYIDAENFGVLLDAANAKYNEAVWRRYAT